MIPFRVLLQPSDFAATVSFLSESMELPVVASWTDDGLGAILQSPSGAQIEVFGVGGGADPDPADRPHRPPVAQHGIPIGLVWEVADVDDWERRLIERGVEIVSRPADQPWGFRSLSVRGPDGLLVTLAQPLSD